VTNFSQTCIVGELALGKLELGELALGEPALGKLCKAKYHGIKNN